MSSSLIMRAYVGNKDASEAGWTEREKKRAYV